MLSALCAGCSVDSPGLRLRAKKSLEKSVEAFMEDYILQLNSQQDSGGRYTYGEWEQTRDLDIEGHNRNDYGATWKLCYSHFDLVRQRSDGKKEYRTYEVVAYTRDCASSELKEDAFALIMITPDNALETYARSFLAQEPLNPREGQDEKDAMKFYKAERVHDFIAANMQYPHRLVNYYGRVLNEEQYDLATLNCIGHRYNYLPKGDEGVWSRIWNFSSNIGIWGRNIIGKLSFLAGLVLVVLGAVFALLGAKFSDTVESLKDIVGNYQELAIAVIVPSLVLPLLIHWGSYRAWSDAVGIVHFLASISMIAWAIMIVLYFIAMVSLYRESKSPFILLLLPAVPLVYAGCMMFGLIIALVADIGILILIIKAMGAGLQSGSSSSGSGGKRFFEVDNPSEVTIFDSHGLTVTPATKVDYGIELPEKPGSYTVRVTDKWGTKDVSVNVY